MNASQRLAMREEKITWETHRITCLTDLEGLIMDLPRAEGQPVFILRKALTDKRTITAEDIGTVKMSDLRLATNYKAVVNTRTDRPAQIAGSGYQILDHGSFIACLVDKLRERNLENAHGYMIVGNGGNKVKIRLIFERNILDEPGFGPNVMFGGEFTNSYDSSYAATGRAFFMRLNCYNQFVPKNIIPEAIFVKPHSAATQKVLLENVTFSIEYFMEHLDEAGVTFKNCMVDSMMDEIIIESPAQIDMLMQDIFKVGVHAEAIAAIAKRQSRVLTRDPKFHVTDRWSLFNAATQYASHEYGISPQTQERIFYRAEMGLLKGPVELPAVPVA